MPLDYLEEREAIRLLQDEPDGVRRWNEYRTITPWPLPRLSLANLEGLSLQGINLDRTYLRGAGFVRSDLSQASLANAYLRRADFRGAQLSRAVLDGADLGEADLRDALIEGTSFLGTNVSGALLGSANRTEARRAGATFCPEDTGRAAVLVEIGIFDPDVPRETVQAISNALAAFMDACEFEIEAALTPVLGSWFQKFKFWSKQQVSPADAEELLEEGKQALLGQRSYLR